MVASLQSFRIGLFEEHLEEASFLYSQCRSLRQDRGTSWHDVAAFEERLDLHLDALVVGGYAALEVAKRRAAEGDFGEIFAAVSLCCRQAQASLLAHVLGQLDTSDPDRTQAVADALKYELPANWTPFVESALAREDDRLLPMLAAASGYRRIPCGPALSAALARLPSPPLALVEAIGRLRVEQAENELRRLLHDDDLSLRSAALLALLRMGKLDALQPLYLGSHKERWSRIALGLAGDGAAALALAQPLDTGVLDEDSLKALGLLGMPGTLRYLYECLADPRLAAAAASAMNWICGAELYEHAFTPAEVNEDELFPRELDVWRKYKEAPHAADGKPFGSSERKLSTERAVWKDWFSHNATRFNAELRYRSGNLYSPAVLLENLTSPHTDGQLRQFAAHELALRYGCHLPFETDMPIAQQRVALRNMGAWVAVHDAAFRPGHWYFNGQAQ